MKMTQLQLAKKQFIEDLKQDQDFIAYKERALAPMKHMYYSYGVVTAYNDFVICRKTPNCQTLLLNYLKSVKRGK
jgi:hypothetical protein